MGKTAFRRFDTDNSGYITVENLQDVLGGTFESNEIEHLMKEADILKDGRISYEEWIVYLRGNTRFSDHAKAADTFIVPELMSKDRRSYSLLEKKESSILGRKESSISSILQRRNSANTKTRKQLTPCCYC